MECVYVLYSNDFKIHTYNNGESLDVDVIEIEEMISIGRPIKFTYHLGIDLNLHRGNNEITFKIEAGSKKYKIYINSKIKQDNIEISKEKLCINVN